PPAVRSMPRGAWRSRRPAGVARPARCSSVTSATAGSTSWPSKAITSRTGSPAWSGSSPPASRSLSQACGACCPARRPTAAPTRCGSPRASTTSRTACSASCGPNPRHAHTGDRGREPKWFPAPAICADTAAIAFMALASLPRGEGQDEREDEEDEPGRGSLRERGGGTPRVRDVSGEERRYGRASRTGGVVPGERLGESRRMNGFLGENVQQDKRGRYRYLR